MNTTMMAFYLWLQQLLGVPVVPVVPADATVEAGAPRSGQLPPPADDTVTGNRRRPTGFISNGF